MLDRELLAKANECFALTGSHVMRVLTVPKWKEEQIVLLAVLFYCS